MQVEWVASRAAPAKQKEGEAAPAESPVWISVSNLSAVKAVVVPAAVRRNPKPPTFPGDRIARASKAWNLNPKPLSSQSRHILAPLLNAPRAAPAASRASPVPCPLFRVPSPKPLSPKP